MRVNLYDERSGVILEAIRDAPNSSFRELAEITGIPLATLKTYLDRMRIEGLITYRPRRHRTIKLRRPK